MLVSVCSPRKYKIQLDNKEILQQKNYHNKYEANNHNIINKTRKNKKKKSKNKNKNNLN